MGFFCESILSTLFFFFFFVVLLICSCLFWAISDGSQGPLPVFNVVPESAGAYGAAEKT